MPWKESSVMDERLRFLARVLYGEPMTEVCRDFVPRLVAADAGFYSAKNEAAAKAKGGVYTKPLD
jgi:hypothetical protein